MPDFISDDPTVYLRMKLFRLSLIGAFLCSAAHLSAQFVVTVNSYTVNTAVHGSYIDLGGIELTNGTTSEGAAVWPGALSGSTLTSLVGWFDPNNADVTFNFGATYHIREIRFWYADSGGASGVAAPTDIQVDDPNSSYSLSASVSSSTSSGTIVMETVTGLNVTTDSLRLTWTPGDQWIMLTEVQFVAVPEPSSYPILLGVAGLGFTLARRPTRRMV